MLWLGCGAGIHVPPGPAQGGQALHRARLIKSRADRASLGLGSLPSMSATAHGSPRPGVECGGRPAEAASPKWPQMARPCGAAIGGGRHSNPGQWSARSGHSRVSAAGRCPSRSNGLRTAIPPMRIARPASHGVGTRVPAARGPHRRAAVPVLPGRKAALRVERGCAEVAACARRGLPAQPGTTVRAGASAQRVAPPRRCGWALATCRVKLAQGRCVCAGRNSAGHAAQHALDAGRQPLPLCP